MKIPKYIYEALQKRTSCACKLLKYDEIVTNFIDKHHIGVDFEDYNGGCEMFLNPYDSEQAVRQAMWLLQNIISTLNKGKNITDCLIQSNRISFYKIYKIMKKGICYDYRTAKN